MRMALGLAVTAALAAALAQQPGRPQRTAAELDQLLASIAGYQHGESRAALSELTLFINDSLRSPTLLRTTEGRLVEFLQSSTTPAAKLAVAKELSAIATEASVPGLAAMLTRPETIEMARYALARIPGPAAADALRKILDGTSGTARAGIIISIGQRRDQNAVPALEALISSAEAGVSDAAISALSNIANRQALAALAAARSGTSGPRQERISNAYLRCAEGLAAQGDRNEALKVYRQLSAPAESDTVRIAALAGLAFLEGKEAVPLLAGEIGSKSPEVQAAAIGLLAGIPGREAIAAMVSRFPQLAPAGQARLVTALALRGDVAAKPVLLQFARTSEREVRVAALAGLGRLGDESSVSILAEAAAAGQGVEQAAARQSLADLQGSKIDEVIVAAINSSTGKVKAELILAAGERRSAGAGSSLVQAAREQDPELRRRALRALRDVAGPEQVAALLDVVQTAEGPDGRDAAQALAAALRRSQSPQIGSAISAYKAASPQVRLALLYALGQAARTESLPVLRGGLSDPNPEIVRGAILALSDWPDPAPLADLFAVASSASDPALRTLALRGCLKLLSLPAPRTNPETTKLLADAMRLANEPAEKKAVLSLLGAYPCEEALKLAEGSLKEAALASEAKASVDRISRALKRR